MCGAVAWASLEAPGSEAEHRDDTPELVWQALGWRDDGRSPDGQHADGDRTATGAARPHRRRDRRGGQGSRQCAASEKTITGKEKGARGIHPWKYDVRDGP